MAICTTGYSIAHSLRHTPINGVDDDASSRLGLSKHTFEPPEYCKAISAFFVCEAGIAFEYK